VQIEYDVETGGAQKAVQLPFIMNVMSDLKGKQQEGEEAVPVENRDFDEIDVSSFEDYLRDTKPRAAFMVDNKLGGEGEQLSVDLTFTSMKDFTPGKIAEQVAPLKELMDARNELKSLLTFMDGRQNAEKAIKELLQNETLMKSLAASQGADADQKGEGE
ncbi:MAG: type VI secretion system contractile sheath small subunit, partial [Paracoccaceae bacterium]